jgi:hypothetical protein
MNGRIARLHLGAVLLRAWGESSAFPWHPGSSFALPQLAPPLAQSASALCLWARPLKPASSIGRHSLRPLQSQHLDNSSGLQFHGVPNLSLNSDPACIVRRSLSTSRFLGSAHRLGAGGAG